MSDSKKVSRDEALDELSSIRGGGGGSSMFDKYRDDVEDLDSDSALRVELEDGYSKVSGLRRWLENNFGEETFEVKSAKHPDDKADDTPQDEATYIAVILKN